MGGSDPSHFIFECQCREETDPTYDSEIEILHYAEFLDRLNIQTRSMSDPTLSDIGFKNKIAWV